MTDINEESEQGEVSIAVIGADGNSIEIIFADGRFAIPPHIVAELGGIAELQKLADTLSNVTYGEFMQGFYEVRGSRMINDYQANFVANHFSPRFF